MRNTAKATLLLTLLLFGTPQVMAEETLLMGVFPRRNATLTAQLFSPLADYLTVQLGKKVKLVTTKDFASFWQGVAEKRYDIVHYNQYHYVHSANDYLVIATNEEQGRDKIAGALYVRRDSGITDITQLRGRKIVFGGGTDAMMSYIVPRFLLQEGGLNGSDYTAVFANNPPNAVLAVYFNKADAAGAGDVVMNLPTVTKIANKGELKFLAISKPIRHLPWAVRKDMPMEQQQRIQKLMVGLGDNEQGQAILKAARLSGIHKAADSDYDTAREIIRKVMSDSTD